ncbi:MAG: cytochrome c oxidase subunit II [Gemmatimonadaceae bacterium]
MLQPGGPAAAEIAVLWWFMFALAVPIAAAVCAALIGAIARARSRRRGNGLSPRMTRNWLVYGAVVMPAVIVTAVFVASERAMGVLHAHAGSDDVVIGITGWQWWWEVRYIANGDTVITANEMHIPTGRRIRVELAAGDVIHSLWVPKLQGKTDLIPGRMNRTWLQADIAGVYGAPCAEYCGAQHSHMTLLVVAEAPEQFEQWLEGQRRPAAAPADSLGRRGAEVFGRAGCAYCHMVRGTGSLGKLGPDLTHLATRRTLAAGTLGNTPADLAAWLAAPQRVKPGNRMPNVALTASELAALVHYLNGLR